VQQFGLAEIKVGGAQVKSARLLGWLGATMAASQFPQPMYLLDTTHGLIEANRRSSASP